MPLGFHDNTLSTSPLPPSLQFLTVSCSSWAPSVGLALSCLLFSSDLIQPSSANDSQVFISSLGLYLDLQHPHMHGNCMCDLSVPTANPDSPSFFLPQCAPFLVLPSVNMITIYPFVQDRSTGSSLLHLQLPCGITSLWALSPNKPSPSPRLPPPVLVWLPPSLPWATCCSLLTLQPASTSVPTVCSPPTTRWVV